MIDSRKIRRPASEPGALGDNVKGDREAFFPIKYALKNSKEDWSQLVKVYGQEMADL